MCVGACGVDDFHEGDDVFKDDASLLAGIDGDGIDLALHLKQPLVRILEMGKGGGTWMTESSHWKI